LSDSAPSAAPGTAPSSAAPEPGLPWRSWVPLLVLSVLLNLPESVHRGLTPWLAIGLNGEVLLLAALAAGRPKLAPLAAITWTGLMTYELARLVSVYLMNQDPVLYDQLQLFSHFALLLRDLWGGAGTAILVLTFLGLAIVTVVASRLFARGLAHARTRPYAIGAVALAALAALPEGPWPARWSLPSLVPNLQESYRVWKTVRTGFANSPYEVLDTLTLTRTPDVEVYIIESYGRIVSDDAKSRAWWGGQLDVIEAQLATDGWHTASGFGTAPVSGGRSWLADASVQLGMRISHESVYRHVVKHTDALPHLPGFLKAQGYDTVVVRPKDRDRPGARIYNYFGWDRGVFHEDMHYDGPVYGWGWIPDQYSLGVLREEVFTEIPSPRMVWFHGVSAHAPWQVIPPMPDDWRSLDDGEAKDIESWNREGAVEELQFQLRRFKRTDFDYRRYKGGIDKLRSRYLKSVAYSMSVSFEHLGEAADAQPDGRIVFIMGDHQPPILSRFDNADVPIHIAATDPALLAPFLERGFERGLIPSADARPATTHEAMLTLITSALAEIDGQVAPDMPDGLDVTHDLEPIRIKKYNKEAAAE